MTRWRRRVGPERLEVLLAESLAAAQRGGAVEEKHLWRVAIGTTVQPKAVTHPTGSKPLQRGIEILVRLARRHGVWLRQSYLRMAEKARREAAKLMYSGRLFRDIGRKIAGDGQAMAAFAGRSTSSRACCGSGARTAAATSSTRCTRRRWSASARARARPTPAIATTKAVAPGGQFVLDARAAKAAPDGHTLLLAASPELAIARSTQRDLPYDPVRDFAPVGLLAQSPFLLLAANALGVADLRELVALAKARPGGLNYASFARTTSSASCSRRRPAWTSPTCPTAAAGR